MTGRSARTVLVATVGTGRNREDIARAIAFSFGKNRADRAVLLCSEKSAGETLPHLLPLLPGDAAVGDVCPEQVEEDVQALLMRWNEKWAEWLEGLYWKDDLAGWLAKAASVQLSADGSDRVALRGRVERGAEARNGNTGDTGNPGRTRPGRHCRRPYWAVLDLNQ